MGTLIGGEYSLHPYVTKNPSNSGIKTLPTSEFVSISRSMGGWVTGFKGFLGDNPCNRQDLLHEKSVNL